ncbi:MAG: symmetrical bis(5'-nucleosyl)-tetraphosphatase [Myxococcota bacterium]
MATYAIGDIQGCFDTLQALLERIQFDPDNDYLWLAGDMVNRGPKSLEVLRWARDLGDRVVAVLGNHDVHLLLRATGLAGRKKRDTLSTVLNAPDRDELIEWLRMRPLMHVQDGYVMVHAGLHPTWSVPEAMTMADEIADMLRGDDWRDEVGRLPCRKKSSPTWTPDLPKPLRIRATSGVFITIRTCRVDGSQCIGFAGPPEDAPTGCRPWFSFPDARWRDHCVLFGHWAALGMQIQDHYIALDSGCVWGGKLTAVRLDDRAVFQVPSIEPHRVLH